MAYDPQSRTTVLFGGRNGASLLGDTWTFDGAAWSRRTTAASPPPLESASLAYDQAAHQLILFGGQGIGGPVDATWAWDGVTWLPMSPATSPPGRYGAALTFDDATRTLLLFGGFSNAAPLADTWTWDGSTWAVHSSLATPPARGGAGLGFDAVHGTAVLFGGSTGSQPLGDTWTWDGTGWVQQHPPAAPSPRQYAATAGDPLLPGAVLVGGTAGTQPLADTWRWDGATWSELAVGSPGPRSGAAIAVDLGGHQILVFGGVGGNGVAFGDTWALKTVAGGIPSTSTPGSISVGPVTPGSTTVPRGPSTSLVGGTPAKPSKAATAMVVTARSVRGGDQVTLTGGGFAPHAPIVVSFHSQPVVMGSTTADAAGHFSLTVAVPADASGGTHHFQAEGAGPAGVDIVLTAAVRVTSLTKHRSWVIPVLMITLTLLISAVAWAATMALARQGQVTPRS